MDKSLLNAHHFLDQASSDEFQKSEITKDFGRPGNVIFASQPQVKSVAEKDLLFIDLEEREKQTKAGNNSPKSSMPSFVGRNKLDGKKSTGPEPFCPKNEPRAGEETNIHNTAYPGSICFASNQDEEIAFLFAGTESAYASKEFGVLINQFENNLETCFVNIKNRFLSENKEKLDVLKTECEKYAVQDSIVKTVLEIEKKVVAPEIFFSGYGGAPGNVYFKKYAESVAIPTLAKFLEIIKGAYGSCTDDEMKQVIMETFPKKLLSIAGEMRGDIAFDNKTDRYRARDSISYGKKNESILFDPVHTYPGWHNIIYLKVKELLVEAFEKASNGKELLKVEKNDLVTALTSNVKFKILADAKDREPFSGGEEFRYLCEVRGLEGSFSGAFRVGLNIYQFTQETLRNLKPENMNIYCFHDFTPGAELDNFLEKLISWKTDDGTEKFKDHLWNLLAMMSKGSYFERGQASITEWLMSAFAKSYKYNLFFDDTWIADGKRVNLTPDLRALSAFDNKTALEEFKTKIQLVADSPQ